MSSEEIIDLEESGCCRSKYCCGMPHGNYVLLPGILSSFAVISSLVVHLIYIMECKSPYGFGIVVSYWGIWFNRYNICYGCDYDYDGSTDIALKTARSGALIATILGCLTVVALWPITCCVYRMDYMYIMAFFFLFLLRFSALSIINFIITLKYLLFRLFSFRWRSLRYSNIYLMVS